jgi:hypothetical protein
MAGKMKDMKREDKSNRPGQKEKRGEEIIAEKL